MWTENFQTFKLDLEKAEEPEIKLPTSVGSQKKQESSRKTSYFCFIDYAKAFDCVDHNKLWKILKEMGIPDHLTCFLRNLYAGQEATVRNRRGTMDWFQIGKGVRLGCLLSPCLFNLYAEYIMRNAWLDEVQAGIKIAGRNINNLRYADDTTVMAENKEELKSILMKVKEKSDRWIKSQYSVHQPQASSIVHWTWTGDSFHTWYYTCFNAILPNLPTLSLSHRVHNTDLYISVSFVISYTGLLLPSF